MMKRRKIRTFEELLAETSTEWQYVPHGLRLIVSEDPGVSSRDRLAFKLTSKEVAQFRPRPRERLQARVSGRTIIVERPKPRPRKRVHRG